MVVTRAPPLADSLQISAQAAPNAGGTACRAPNPLASPAQFQEDVADVLALRLKRRLELRHRRAAIAEGLTRAGICSTFVLMEVETPGTARSLGWKVHMRCAEGYREGTKSIRRCVYRKQLDLDTLVCTRGPNFPLSRLDSRLMCPACGSRSVTVVFEPPTNREARSG